MDAKLESLFNWNTNLVFASLLCEWHNPEQDFMSSIVVWDKRMPRVNTDDYHV